MENDFEDEVPNDVIDLIKKKFRGHWFNFEEPRLSVFERLLVDARKRYEDDEKERESTDELSKQVYGIGRSIAKYVDRESFADYYSYDVNKYDTGSNLLEVYTMDSAYFEHLVETFDDICNLNGGRAITLDDIADREQEFYAKFRDIKDDIDKALTLKKVKDLSRQIVP